MIQIQFVNTSIREGAFHSLDFEHLFRSKCLFVSQSAVTILSNIAVCFFVYFTCNAQEYRAALVLVQKGAYNKHRLSSLCGIEATKAACLKCDLHFHN